MTLILYYLFITIEFLLVTVVGIALISIFLHHISENFNLKYINLYGFFSRLDDVSLIMLSSSILKEITLIYCVLKISSFSSIYLYIFVIFCFTYAFFSFKITTFIKEIIISSIEYLIIYFLSLLSLFLVEVRHSNLVVYYIWILSALLVICSIFLFARSIFYVLTSNKHVRRSLFAK